MPPVALNEKLTDDAVTRLVALGLIPETYGRILTFTRLKALRFDFMVKRRFAKEDSLRQRFQQAGDLLAGRWPSRKMSLRQLVVYRRTLRFRAPAGIL